MTIKYDLQWTLEGHKGPINCASFTEDGSFLATGSKYSIRSGVSDRQLTGDDCHVIVWKMHDGAIIRQLKPKQGPVVAVRWLRDNSHSGVNCLISAGANGTLVFWRFNASSVSHHLMSHRLSPNLEYTGSV